MNDINFDVGGNIFVIAILWIFRNLIVVGISLLAIYFAIKYFYRKYQESEENYDILYQYKRESWGDKIKRFLNL